MLTMEQREEAVAFDSIMEYRRQEWLDTRNDSPSKV